MITPPPRIQLVDRSLGPKLACGSQVIEPPVDLRLPRLRTPQSRQSSRSVGLAKVTVARGGFNPKRGYFTSTVAPASVNFFLIVSASSFETPSFTVFGAPSTRSLASFKPRLVTSRTALITLILFAPTSLRTTVNSVFSSAGAAPAPAAAPPPATTTGAAAAADTPRRSSSFFTRAAASSSDKPTICSSSCCRSAMWVLQFLLRRHGCPCLASLSVFFDFVIPRPGFQCDQALRSAPDNAKLRTAQPLA